MTSFRHEHDLLGPRDVPADALWGVYTERAIKNVPLVRLACGTSDERLVKCGVVQWRP